MIALMLLAANKLDSSKCMRWDTDDPDGIMAAKRISNRPIVFKYCINGDEKVTGHNAVPMNYIPQLMKVMRLKHEESMLSSQPDAKKTM